MSLALIEKAIYGIYILHLIRSHIATTLGKDKGPKPPTVTQVEDSKEEIFITGENVKTFCMKRPTDAT